ncbi:hypothetical protein CSC43_0037 [Pseudomonas aeruginosa]|nr:hypothetical protein CSC43_0037 [Pseudomonas aeruginosa]
MAGEDVARTAAAVLRADPVPPGELAITGPQALTAEALVNSINIIFGASIDLVPSVRKPWRCICRSRAFRNPRCERR